MTKHLIAAFAVIAAASPAAMANTQQPPAEIAPAGTPDTRYCMRVLLTGSIIEPVRCWTRDEWAEQGVDVDKDWADEGIRVIG